MQALKTIAITIIGLYAVVVMLLYFFQTRLIFYPGKLSKNFRFSGNYNALEVFLVTEDGERINGLFYDGKGEDVILYFHGNAGDLSGWQFVSEDFTAYGYKVFIIDYRGYGKSSGSISEKGFYHDAEAAWQFLTDEKGVPSSNIIIYGRSIGTGVPVELATRHLCKGVVLESPYTSLPSLANEKFPLFFPGWYLKYRFDNLTKINSVKAPLILLHGSSDTLIPASHTQRLFDKFDGKKRMILFEGASHNDLNSYKEHRYFIEDVLPFFFD